MFYRGMTRDKTKPTNPKVRPFQFYANQWKNFETGQLKTTLVKLPDNWVN